MRVITLVGSIIIGLGLSPDLFANNISLRYIAFGGFLFAIWQDMVDYSLISRMGE